MTSRLLPFVAILLSLGLTAAPARAQEVTTTATHAYLIDDTTGTVLFEKNADQRMHPSSMSKLMTVYMVFQQLKEGRLKMDDTFPVSEKAWRMQGSKMFVALNSRVSVEELLRGVIIQSGNDACIVLAENLAGSEEAFAQMMNREAQRLGMKGTHFVNSTGLPDPQHYATAYDLALLAIAIIRDFPEYHPLYSMKEYRYNNITQANRNRLLWSDPTVDGMKTGHTQAAGYCLIASAVRPNGSDQRRLISVVLGAESDNMRAQESQKLLNWGFMNFQSFKIYSKDQAVLTPVVWKGSKDEVRLGFNRDVYVSLPRGSTANLKSVVQRTDPLIAPIPQYHQVGTLKVLADGKVISELPLQALDQINEATIFGRAFDSLRLMLPH